MQPRISSLVYLKPLWTHSCARSAAFVKASQFPPRRALAKVCLKWTWPSTYSRRPAPPLHVSLILERIQSNFGVTVDRESLVSSLTKKVARGDRFLRPQKNTFSLRPETR